MNQNIEGSTTEFSSPQNNFPVNMLWQSADGMWVSSISDSCGILPLMGTTLRLFLPGLGWDTHAIHSKPTRWRHKSA